MQDTCLYGHPITPTDLFCVTCGSRITRIVTAPPLSTRLRALVTAALVLLVALIGGSVFNLTTSSESAQASTLLPTGYTELWRMQENAKSVDSGSLPISYTPGYADNYPDTRAWPDTADGHPADNKVVGISPLGCDVIADGKGGTRVDAICIASLIAAHDCEVLPQFLRVMDGGVHPEGDKVVLNLHASDYRTFKVSLEFLGAKEAQTMTVNCFSDEQDPLVHWYEISLLTRLRHIGTPVDLKDITSRALSPSASDA